MKNISWNTKKVSNGFIATVYENISHNEPVNGLYCTRKNLKTFTVSTRAKAKYHAQKLVRYYKATL